MTTNQPSNHLLKMVLLGSAVLIGLAAALFAETPEAKVPESVGVFLIDDQTGEELATKHGILPLAVGDLEVLINAVLQGTTPVKVLHQAVDEEAADNAVATLDFRLYAGGQPPKAPSPGLPLSQLALAVQNYRKQRAQWQQGMLAYRQDLVSQIERFVAGVTVTQLEVAEKFDRMLAARAGRDFNRSDIAGAVVAANRMLGIVGRKVLVLNTDALDLPANRTARNTPFTPEELDPAIELIFVNTSGLPDQSPLFRGLPNPVQHADSVKAALELIMPPAQTSAEADKDRASSVASR
jgi:hypothetical protein